MIMTKDERVTDHYNHNTKIPTSTDPTPLRTTIGFTCGFIAGMILLATVLAVIA